MCDILFIKKWDKNQYFFFKSRLVKKMTIVTISNIILKVQN